MEANQQDQAQQPTKNQAQQPTKNQAQQPAQDFSGTLSFDQSPSLNVQIPEGAKVEDINKTLSQIGIDGVDTLKSFASKYDNVLKEKQTYQAKYDQLQKEYEAKTAVSPFANPMVEKLNEMYKAEQPFEKIEQFLRVQSLNVDQLDPQAAIRHRMKMQYPDLSDEEINGVFRNKYPIQEGEEVDESANAAIRAQMKMDGAEAKEWIKGQQVTAKKSPEQIAKEEAQSAQKQQYVKTWENLSSRVLSETPNSLKFVENSQQIGGDYSFEYDPKLTDQEQAHIQKQLHQFAISNNLPLTEQSLSQLADFKNKLIKIMKMDDYVKHLAYDIVAGMTEKFTKQRGVPQAQTPAPKQQRGQAKPKKKASGVPRSPNDTMV